MFGQGRNRFYNVLTVLLLLLTVTCIALTVVYASGAAVVPIFAPATPVVPGVAEIPSPTVTDTPIPPTWTATFTKTVTPSNTPTETFTVTPSLTITSTPAPTETPTSSTTPTETPTGTSTMSPVPPTPTPTPTGPTASPFPFVVQGERPVYTANFANTAGCAWQGIGGQVFGLNGEGLVGYRVRVTGGSLESGGRTVTTGSNTLYGQPSGWEVQVSGQTNTQTYYVELLSPDGTPVSAAIPVSFPNNCAQNLALITFVQVRAT